MSRTYKDKKWELRFPEDTYSFDRIQLVGFWNWIQRPGVKTKKKRSVERWHWYRGTPSAWTRLMMNRPQRRMCRLWEQEVLFQDVEDADCPFYGKKPHIYYW